MAERLTERDSIDNKRYMLNSENNQITLTYAKLNNGFRKAYYYGEPIDKLAQLEDIMEKYDIEDLEQLDIMLFCLSSETKFQLKQLQKLYKKYNIKSMEELEKKLADSDTWQKACELASSHISWCPAKQGECNCAEEKRDCTNFFYQQAKKEKENKNDDTNQ